MGNIKVIEIKDALDNYFQYVIEIYENSFPANERLPKEVFIKGISSKRYRIFVGLHEGQCIGFVILYYLNNKNFILLDYFALAENVRGRGFGTEFIRSVIEGLDLYSNNQLLFLEVEDPKYGDNYSERCRRINFYKRLGVNIIKDVHYILPPLSGDDPTDMVIMVYPKPQENQFSSDLCRSLIVDLYINKYHRDMDDIFLKNSLQSIPQRIEYE